ncbi:hypothetical protein PC128_g7025 [Phytophthora cactorum]|nr:hypothetical protein PC120_g7161 [Phytophthora cactorum]KAG3081850.1 hypothetical protein PC121_g6340 [Phytophthora cactorum]KAG3197161.1 hypothetical protein PC128_g7025 [Phytophthora cactorum]KAG4037338.1 hypothetical protein PC123_g27096 [Phytophthora cactorum]
MSLSDNVIGDVVTRGRSMTNSNSGELSIDLSPRSKPSDETKDMTPMNSSSSQQQSRNLAPLLSTKKTPPVPAADPNGPMDAHQRGARLRQLQKIQQHRERCRQNQASYRRRQKNMETNLESDIRRLRIEIGILELGRHSSIFGAPMPPTVWSVAAEYFRLFRHGSPPQAHYSYATRFFEKSMASNVTDGLLVGPDALLANWRIFSLYFDDVDFKLERVEERAAESVLISTTATSITITSDTLRAVFLHLNSDAQGGTAGGEWSALATKLVDQRLVLYGSVKFYWDDSSNCVLRMETQSDLLTPMLRILGSLKDVSQVFSGAFVKPDCTLVPNHLITRGM